MLTLATAFSISCSNMNGEWNLQLRTRLLKTTSVSRLGGCLSCHHCLFFATQMLLALFFCCCSLPSAYCSVFQAMSHVMTLLLLLISARQLYDAFWPKIRHTMIQTTLLSDFDFFCLQRHWSSALMIPPLDAVAVPPEGEPESRMSDLEVTVPVAWKMGVRCCGAADRKEYQELSGFQRNMYLYHFHEWRQRYRNDISKLGPLHGKRVNCFQKHIYLSPLIRV